MEVYTRPNSFWTFSELNCLRGGGSSKASGNDIPGNSPDLAITYLVYKRKQQNMIYKYIYE